MTEAQKSQAMSIISLGTTKIVNNYSENALLLNSCFVAKNRYETLTETNGLSTIRNIPTNLRLENEIDVQYSNSELVENYRNELPNIIFKNYIIVSVSNVDATLEDLYEHLLKIYEANINENEVERRIRNAWTNDGMLSYLIDPLKSNLQKPNGLETSFTEALMRYSELRILRHTLLHTNGKLSEKNKQKLENYLNSTPDERKNLALINSPLFNQDWQITLNINQILAIRRYLYDYLMYLFHSINERTVI